MKNTFTHNETYTIITEFSFEFNECYITVKDTLNDYEYHTLAGIDLEKLLSNIQPKDAYAIITKCLSITDNDYIVNIFVIQNKLIIKFDVLIGGLVKINFEFSLEQENINMDDKINKTNKRIKQITDKCNTLEETIQKQNDTLSTLYVSVSQCLDKVKSLEENIIIKNKEIIDMNKILSYSQICIHHGNRYNSHEPFHPPRFVNLNVKEIDNFIIEQKSPHYSKPYNHNIERIKYLQNLETLTIQTLTQIDIDMIESKSLKYLTISVDNINSVEFLTSLPRLEKLKLLLSTNNIGMPSIPVILKKYNHSIKHIIIRYNKKYPYKGIEFFETYCYDNNIRIEKEGI